MDLSKEKLEGVFSEGEKYLLSGYASRWGASYGGRNFLWGLWKASDLDSWWCSGLIKLSAQA